jgi:hypothetical protein
MKPRGPQSSPPSRSYAGGQRADLSRLDKSELEIVMNEWLKPQIQETEAGIEVTSYLPAELDRA